ncbi:hypothetical protein DFH07DRAFT_346356 [Mycena maculata]|uniref:Uncharacterized protein n=1 Tax=Mycena maculata TaxID=230809 RepID=A0AAD7MH72_9AGAR|nr:hypothetical protein DFH07DRAFT_346356 [Mycena maculata]
MLPANLSTSRAPTRTGSIASRRPRPRSPLSMYVAYEMSPPKAPKPLLKLDKTVPKAKAPKTQTEPEPPDPVPVQADALPEPSPLRLPVISLFGRRRKTISEAASGVPARTEIAGPAPAPPLRSSQPNSPIDYLEPVGRPDRADALSYKALPAQPSDPRGSTDGDGVTVSDYSGSSGMSSSMLDRGSSEGSYSVEEESESLEDEGLTADIARESRRCSPIEFAASRRASVIESFVSEFDVNKYPGSITPVVGASSKHRLFDSRPSSPAIYYRPDTPFMDTIVAVDSEAVRGHTREASVVRKEMGWMGAWNQDDMRVVIDKLRSLK